MTQQQHLLQTAVTFVAAGLGLGTQTLTPEGRQAFAESCTVMRAEAARERASFEDISFS
jgi:hypothetical protein